jgi:hypothetical protein
VDYSFTIFCDDLEFMKKIAILFVLILAASTFWGQADSVFIKYNEDKFGDVLKYKTDTVVFDTPNARQILYGTMVLPWTSGQQVAKNFGVELQKVTSTDCDESAKAKGNEVIAITETDTTLNIEIKIYGNCCHSFLCDFEILDDSIINLKYYGYGATYCSCECCFGLSYFIEKSQSEFYHLLKQVMVNNDRFTIQKLR